MKTLLKTIVDGKVITIFQAHTDTILSGYEVPESTEYSIEVGDLVQDLIDGIANARTILKSTEVIVKTMEINWLMDAVKETTNLDRNETEKRLRNCLLGIRKADQKNMR